MKGKPFKYTPIQLENIKSERGQPAETKSTEQEETYIIIHPDYNVEQPQTIESYQRKSGTSKLVNYQLLNLKLNLLHLSLLWSS